MRTIICILACVSMASTVSALSITNGDFEAPGIREDVPGWYDDQGGGTFLRLLYSLNDTQYMGLAWENAWAYQSIGYNTEDVPALQVQYEIAAVEPLESVGDDQSPTNPRNLVLTVSIYESDGSFVPADNRDIDGADGVTLIDSVEVAYPGMPVDGETVVTDSVLLQYLDATSGELFLRFENTGDGDAKVGSGDNETNDRFSLDNVQIVEPVSVVNPLPKDGTLFVAVQRDAAENDLVFEVVDEAIEQVKVRFAPDPNLVMYAPIKTFTAVSPGQYTVTLESEWPQALDWDTDYYWQVLAYEPNAVGDDLFLKYASPIFTYETIQDGPWLGDVTPGKLPVYPGDDAVFSLTLSSKADTYQWYKDGVGALANGADYAGVDTQTLTVLDCQAGDEGMYYCIATETASGKTARSLTDGELRMKLLVAYYPFEETFEDAGKLYTYDVAGGRHMQLMSGAGLSETNPIVGKNLWLDNPKNQYAQIPDTSVAHYEDITISFWANATTLERWAPVFEFGEGTQYMMFTMYYRQDDPRQDGFDVARCEFRYIDANKQEQNPELDVEHPDIAAGRWYFVAITIEADEDGQGGSGRIYLGGEHGTEAETPQVLNVPSPVEFPKTLHYLGRRFSYTSDPLFNGRIDEFKIYNYVRTSEEIAKDFFDIQDDDPICDMENYDLYDYDFNRNCKVDLPDFAEIAQRWMTDYRIFPD